MATTTTTRRAWGPRWNFLDLLVKSFGFVGEICGFLSNFLNFSTIFFLFLDIF